MADGSLGAVEAGPGASFYWVWSQRERSAGHPGHKSGRGEQRAQTERLLGNGRQRQFLEA